ncbi:MAG TPA: hypothetical protein VE195_05995, partial [Acidobacteriaceae bacterium]|nr:hypothetical protein [Acidobacteriaceae bacterium]
AADQKLYLTSMQSTVNSYDEDVDQLRGQPTSDRTLQLKDLDFDTGKPTERGEYPLADKTYAKLLDTVTHDKKADISSDLRTSLLNYYEGFRPRHMSRFDPAVLWNRKRQKLERNLALLRAKQPQPTTVANLSGQPVGNLGHAPGALEVVQQR